MPASHYSITKGLSRHGSLQSRLVHAGAPGLSESDRAGLTAKAHGYLKLGVRYTQTSQPFLCLTQGLSGLKNNRLGSPVTTFACYSRSLGRRAQTTGRTDATGQI